MAAARSIERLLKPNAVAVIGASRNPAKLGAAILRNLVGGGFTGAVYPVNPAGGEIDGLKVWPAIDQIGAPVDLAVVAVPAAEVEGEIVKCARAGVFGVVVIATGFDAGGATAGVLSEERLFELVRGLGMRMVGPSCMGLMNTDPALSLNATLAPLAALPGGIGFFSQSGALGIAVIEHARARGLGFSTFVSAGRRTDVSSNDLLAYWSEDPRTKVVGLYLENVGNPRKFAWLAPRTGAPQADRGGEIRSRCLRHPPGHQPYLRAGESQRRGRFAVRTGRRDPDRHARGIIRRCRDARDAAAAGRSARWRGQQCDRPRQSVQRCLYGARAEYPAARARHD
jgi:succinyl-CoA synthetase alpha subunit